MNGDLMQVCSEGQFFQRWESAADRGRWELQHGRVFMDLPPELPGSGMRGRGGHSGALAWAPHSNLSGSAQVHLHRRIQPKISSEEDGLPPKYHLKPLF